MCEKDQKVERQLAVHTACRLMSTYRGRAAATPHAVVLLHGMLALPAVKRMQLMRAQATHGNVRAQWAVGSADKQSRLLTVLKKATS